MSAKFGKGFGFSREEHVRFHESLWDAAATEYAFHAMVKGHGMLTDRKLSCCEVFWYRLGFCKPTRQRTGNCTRISAIT